MSRYDPRADGAVDPRPRRARLLHRDQGGPRHPERRRAGSTSRTCRARRSCSACRASTRRCSSCRCSTSPPTPIEIAPTAHYSMGGVWVRPEDHGTGVDGPLRDRRGVERPARREPARRQLADRAARVRPDRRRGRRRVLGRLAGAAALGRRRWPRRAPRSTSCSPPTGQENVRALQRAIRDTMTEHAGVVRDESGLLAGLAELDDDRGAHRATSACIPTSPGFQDLAHAFDLKAVGARRARDARGGARAPRDARLPQPLATTRSSTRRCRSTSSGPARTRSSASRSHPSPTTYAT